MSFEHLDGMYASLFVKPVTRQKIGEAPVTMYEAHFLWEGGRNGNRFDVILAERTTEREAQDVVNLARIDLMPVKKQRA